MSWFIYASVAAGFYAAAEIISKYISSPGSKPIYLGLFSNLFAFAVSLIFTFTTPIEFRPEFGAVLGIIVSGALYAGSTLAYFASLKITDVSEFSLLSRSRLLFVIIGGMIIYHEHIVGFQWVSIILIITGVVLVNYTGKSIRFHRGSWLAIIVAVLIAAGVLIDKYSVAYFSPALYASINYLVTIICLIPFAVRAYSGGAALPRISSMRLMMISSALYAVSNFSFMSAYKYEGKVSLVQLISQLQIPIIVSYGVIVLKERTNVVQKILAAVLIILGTLLIRS